MTTQTETRIATGRVERIANSGRSFYLNGNRMFTQGNNDQGEIPPAGAAIRVEYKPWVSGDGQRTVNYYSRWDFDMSASQELPVRQLENPSQNAHSAPTRGGGQGVHNDKPIVTRLACLNAAIATIGQSQQGQIGAQVESNWRQQEIMGLAETYVAWALYGGTGSKVEKDPPASEVLYNAEYDPSEISYPQADERLGYRGTP